MMASQAWVAGFIECGYAVLNSYGSTARDAVELARDFYRQPTENLVRCHLSNAIAGARGFSFGEADFALAKASGSLDLLQDDTTWSPGQSARGYSSYDLGRERPDETEPIRQFLFAQNLYPSEELRPRIDTIYERFAAIGASVAMTIAEEVGSSLSVSDLDYSSIRLLHYSAGVDGWSKAHSDYEFIALIAASEQGLEVQTQTGVWERLEVQDGELALLAGDCLQSFSNGRIKAVSHRVALGLERYSVPYFQGLPLDHPLTEVGMTFGEHIAGRLVQSFPHLRTAHEAGGLLPSLDIPTKNPFHSGVK